eukprot:Ihof_evm4s159 gene=Ihof_evmTU4s159
MAAVGVKKNDVAFSDILKNAGKRALGGGLPGAAAMGVQVCSLMWLRTTMNYQYRHGTSTTVAIKTLYKEGGIPRFYKGIGPALIQGPLSRFGDTAANAGVLALLDSFDTTRSLPVGLKTACASMGAASWRLCLMPIDTTKTIMQVEGKQGLSILRAKFAQGGIPVFFQGAIAASSATFVGHFPWFCTYNYLNGNLPQASTKVGKLSRNAFMGFCSSVVSDTCSNSIRVVKTTKQTSETPITYVQTVKMVVKADGWIGLFGRGLRTRLMTNAIQ